MAHDPLMARLLRRMRRGADRADALKLEGAPGKATVVQAKPTNRHIRRGRGPGGYVHKMHLRIEAEGMEPYELEKSLVPKVGPSGCEPGQIWPVYVDREDRENILVDWGALLASGQTITIGPGITIQSQGPLITTPATSEQTLGDRMLELHRLRDAGLITAEEFAQQRARLVDGA